MKKITLALLTLVVSFTGIKLSAQDKYGPNADECKKYLSFYDDYYKQKNYDDALPNWRKAYAICPATASENMLIKGSTLLSRQIAKTKDVALRNAIIDSLLTLQDQRAATYPKNAVKALNNKARYIVQYKLKDNQFVFDEIGKIIEQNQELTNFASYVPYFNAAVALKNEGKLDVEKVLDVYEASVGMLEKAAATDSVELVARGIDKDDIKKINEARNGLDLTYIDSKIASCEDLLGLFTPRYEADPSDMALNAKIVGMLNTVDGCQNNDLYLKAATALYRNEPTAKTAYSLYRLNLAQGNTDAALKYIEEACSFNDVDNATKAKYNMEASNVCVKKGMTAKASSYANKAADLDSSYQGRAYYITGTIWASTRCGGDEVTSRANLWVAVDYLQRAKAADPSLAGDCNALIGRYSASFPAKADAFMYDIVDGQSYTVNCGGMHATTTVRTR